jgi:hypothetical protein
MKSSKMFTLGEQEKMPPNIRQSDGQFHQLQLNLLLMFFYVHGKL